MDAQCVVQSACPPGNPLVHEVPPMAKWPAMMNLAGVAAGEVAANTPGKTVVVTAATGQPLSGSSCPRLVLHGVVVPAGLQAEDSGADSSTTSHYSPDGHSGQKSPHKEVSPKMNKSRNEKFHKLFKTIPDNEVVLNAYSCAYFGDILLQGNLYISPNWFCFHSRILGHETLIEIHVSKVLNITREKTAFIIPNAIGIKTADDKFVFGSLMSRDSTYKLMWSVWKQARAGGILDSNKDIGDGDVSDNNGSLNCDGGDLSTDNNNELLKAPSCGTHVSEDTSDSDSGALCGQCGDDNLLTCIQEGPKARVVRSSSHGYDGNVKSLEERTREKKSKDYIPYSLLERPFTATSQFVTKAASIPRTSLLLAVCGILVLLLMLSAIVMTYKIMVLQARLDNNLGFTDTRSPESGETLYRDVYFLNNQYHTATVERFHSVVRANIELLGQVHNSLKSLQTPVGTTSSSEESCEKPHEHTETLTATDDTTPGES